MIHGILCSMADIAATFGTGTLLVLQPSTTDPIALRVALGIQRLWAQWLRDAGRHAVRTVAVGRLERLTDAHGVDADSDAFAVGDKFVVHFAAPPDVVLGPLVAGYSARWGLQSAFELHGPAFRLGTRLFEVRDAAVHPLEELAFDGELLDLPRRLFEVVTSTAQRTGVRAPWHHWSEVFTTGDPEAALHYLAAVGTWTMVEEGARMTVADAFEPVVRALASSPNMTGAIEVARALTRILGEGGVPSLALARQTRRLRELGVHLGDG